MRQARGCDIRGAQGLDDANHTDIGTCVMKDVGEYEDGEVCGLAIYVEEVCCP